MSTSLEVAETLAETLSDLKAEYNDLADRVQIAGADWGAKLAWDVVFGEEEAQDEPQNATQVPEVASAPAIGVTVKDDDPAKGIMVVSRSTKRGTKRYEIDTREYQFFLRSTETVHLATKLGTAKDRTWSRCGYSVAEGDRVPAAKVISADICGRCLHTLER